MLTDKEHDDLANYNIAGSESGVSKKRASELLSKYNKYRKAYAEEQNHYVKISKKILGQYADKPVSYSFVNDRAVDDVARAIRRLSSR